MVDPGVGNAPDNGKYDTEFRVDKNKKSLLMSPRLLRRARMQVLTVSMYKLPAAREVEERLTVRS